MYKQLSVGVVVPAFNEERAIAAAVTSVPAWVDHVVVVDDASADATARRAAACARPGASLEVVSHPANRGVGAAIVTGYRRVLASPQRLDVAVVMAGDGQMDPADLPRLLDPIAAGEADYSKGNRFLHPDVWRAMPKSRLFGNAILSVATKVTSGYWHVFDSQCGYTAITRRALERIDLGRLFPRYGYPNDVLARLRAADMRVIDVAVRPVYGPEWKSGIRIPTVVYPVTYVLMRSWLGRLGRRAASQLRGGREPGSRPLPVGAAAARGEAIPPRMPGAAPARPAPAAALAPEARARLATHGPPVRAGRSQ